MDALRRGLIGAAVAVAGVAVLAGLLLPFRQHLTGATTALVFVLPIVLGVVIGGFRAGMAGLVASFLVNDLLFVPPYGTLTVGSSSGWVSLLVYAAVTVVVTQVVHRLRAARAESGRHEEETRRLFELSDALIAEQSLAQLLGVIVATVRSAFRCSGVALLLPTERGLAVGAAAGEPFQQAELAEVVPSAGAVSSLEHGDAPGRHILTVPLVASARPVGALIAKGAVLRPYERALLATYANQAAFALERAGLREQALRSQLLEEVDHWRSALMGAVSHDLRTPLATVKAAVSDLRRSDVELSAGDRDELLGLVEAQSDRLARLVTNLLDMTRIQSGALAPRRQPLAFEEVLGEALAVLAGTDVGERVGVELEEGLPLVEVDHALIGQVLANLLDNASRHTPEGGPIEVRARARGVPGRPGKVEVTVADHGPGIDPDDRERIFLMYSRVSGAGRAGLGLAIAKAFVEAHGESISVAEAPGGGACFAFTLPAHADGPAPHRDGRMA